MIELMARLAIRKTRTTFLTLTFHNPPTPTEAKRAFKMFTMRYRRDYPAASAIWRMEYQERGAIHFHLLYFNLPYIDQKDIQIEWEECTREDRSIIHVKRIKGGQRQAMAYVSKYLAKTDRKVLPSLDDASYQHSVSLSSEPGRFWGWVNRALLPFAMRFETVLDDDNVIAYLWWTVKALTRGRGGSQRAALRWYSDDAYEMLAWIVENGDNIGGFMAHEGVKPAHWWEFTDYAIHDEYHLATDPGRSFSDPFAPPSAPLKPTKTKVRYSMTRR